MVQVRLPHAPPKHRPLQNQMPRARLCPVRDRRRRHRPSRLLRSRPPRLPPRLTRTVRRRRRVPTTHRAQPAGRASRLPQGNPSPEDRLRCRVPGPPLAYPRLPDPPPRPGGGRNGVRRLPAPARLHRRARPRPVRPSPPAGRRASVPPHLEPVRRARPFPVLARRPALAPVRPAACRGHPVPGPVRRVRETTRLRRRREWGRNVAVPTAAVPTRAAGKPVRGVPVHRAEATDPGPAAHGPAPAFPECRAPILR